MCRRPKERKNATNFDINRLNRLTNAYHPLLRRISSLQRGIFPFNVRISGNIRRCASTKLLLTTSKLEFSFFLEVVRWISPCSLSNFRYYGESFFPRLTRWLNFFRARTFPSFFHRGWFLARNLIEGRRGGEKILLPYVIVPSFDTNRNLFDQFSNLLFY